MRQLYFKNSKVLQAYSPQPAFETTRQSNVGATKANNSCANYIFRGSLMGGMRLPCCSGFTLVAPPEVNRRSDRHTVNSSALAFGWLMADQTLLCFILVNSEA